MTDERTTQDIIASLAFPLLEALVSLEPEENSPEDHLLMSLTGAWAEYERHYWPDGGDDDE